MTWLVQAQAYPAPPGAFGLTWNVNVSGKPAFRPGSGFK
jgi:hypothetical protein